jgi:hypothetical protein
MNAVPSSPFPGWWQRTWPLVALGVLSVVMWAGRIRNVLGDEDLVGVGRAVRLVVAIAFVALGVALLVACRVGRQQRNWRRATVLATDGWRVGPGVPAWGRSVAQVLVALTVVVWLVQGIGIVVDPNHAVGFKVVHTFLMTGSLVVAGFGAWGLRRSWPVASTTRATMPG